MWVGVGVGLKTSEILLAVMNMRVLSLDLNSGRICSIPEEQTTLNNAVISCFRQFD